MSLGSGLFQSKRTVRLLSGDSVSDPWVDTVLRSRGPSFLVADRALPGSTLTGRSGSATWLPARCHHSICQDGRSVRPGEARVRRRLLSGRCAVGSLRTIAPACLANEHTPTEPGQTRGSAALRPGSHRLRADPRGRDVELAPQSSVQVFPDGRKARQVSRSPCRGPPTPCPPALTPSRSLAGARSQPLCLPVSL